MRYQRCKIIHPVDREDHAYVLTLIGLSGSLVVEQVRGERSEVIHIFMNACFDATLRLLDDEQTMQNPKGTYRYLLNE